MPQLGLYIDKETKGLIDKTERTWGRRDVSMSMIAKWILLSIILPENELLKQMRKHKHEVKLVTEVLQENIKRLNRV